jgi:catechol 2,3-dioxygenase-like lactoylglutathione lyase family enzyme
MSTVAPHTKAGELQLSPRPTLLSLNHVSFLSADVARTRDFYMQVLGFLQIERPGSFDFEGCWCAVIILRSTAPSKASIGARPGLRRARVS